jgi:uncharacterized protein involved in exopolysaccharide biosynthesis
MTQSGPRPAVTGLAAQFGINLGGSSDPTLSPEFYADLLSSRPVLERTVRARYPISSRDSTQTLAQLYGGEDRAIDRVRGGINSSINSRTGVISLSVSSDSPGMAQQIAQELLRQLDDFNKQRRKSRVSSERQFTEARLAEAAAQLRASEDSLQSFYTRNRDFERSPELRFREDRLTREVGLRQQVYSTLAQAFEQSKIDEVRDTPVITVLEEPSSPRHGDSRHTIDRVVLAMSLGTLAAFALALLLDSAKTTKFEKTDELDEFRALGRQFAYELRNPLSTARRVLS